MKKMKLYQIIFWIHDIGDKGNFDRCNVLAHDAEEALKKAKKVKAEPHVYIGEMSVIGTVDL
jgi:hypothetical protein